MSAFLGHLGLSDGYVLDLTVDDPESGLPWDFAQPLMRERALTIVIRDRPQILLGSPHCLALTVLQQRQHPPLAPALVAKLVLQCVEHLRFCVQLYRMQAEGGRFFVHEHTAGHASWRLKAL